MLDGSFQGPVRNDLDGILSKVDQSLIASTQTISGPYGLRYGSGYAFINVDTIPTTRYECGWENHVRLGTSVRGNGGQTYNTATIMGGDQNSGFYTSVGYRKGSDYRSGGGLDLPSSYEAGNLFSAYGFDIDDVTRSETKISFLDQGPTEYAAQFFDINSLRSEGITQSIIQNDEQTGFGYRIDGWYSNTEFDGDTEQSGKNRIDFPVIVRVEEALRDQTGNTGEFRGDVDGNLQLAGFRAGFKQKYDDGSSVAAGADFHYIKQTISEQFDISDFVTGGGTNPGVFNTGLPTAELFDPGLYAEASNQVTPYWNVATAARIAFVMTQADAGDVRDRSNFRDPFSSQINQDLDVSDTLLSYYITNDIEINPTWRGRIGLGYAERSPDLTSRYADGVFLSVIQNGFTRVIGAPSLSKERNYQFDVRADGNYENVRVRLSAFHAWILDYNTYAANVVRDPLGARLLQSVNTDLATLAGFEAYGEGDLTRGMQVFTGLSYLDGRDRQIDQPLGGISPLEGRIGMRFTDPTPEQRYGLEWGWRIVDNQDRLGSYRPVFNAGGNAQPISLEQATPGFSVSYLRSYLRPTDNVSLTAGVENLFDKNYFEHLNLRLPADAGNRFSETAVFSPGITPYVGMEVNY